MPTFKCESRNEKNALFEKFTVIAVDLDAALGAARADQEKQWSDCGEKVRITSIVETDERVITAQPAAAKGASSSD